MNIERYYSRMIENCACTVLRMKRTMIKSKSWMEGESHLAPPAGERCWCGIGSEDDPLNYGSIEVIR
jgi:hypothetical protein